MKKLILSAVLAAALVLSSLSTASAMSVDVYGGAKMNIWDFYLTENNDEKPDSLTGATVDAVSQATYNMYDNLPVEITAGMDFDLLADCMIMDAQGLKNTSITKILQTWKEGYKTTLLGNSKTDITYPIDKSLVKVTLNDGQILYVPYRAVAEAVSSEPGFLWTAFLKELAETAPTVSPYRVKYILETGEFGKGFLVSDADAKAAPVLTLDETYNNDSANKNIRVKINFGNDTDWAKAVYAVAVNGSGLISGETGDHASSTVIQGETSFLKGSNPKNTAEFIIRLSQKFRIGDNTITVMAHGYKDAALTIPVTELSNWMVDVSAKNQDTNASLSENSTVSQGAVILVESKMKSNNNPGEFNSVWIDGRLIPKVGGKDDATKYTQTGKTLSYYTDTLAAGQHELRLKRFGHPDSVFLFIVTDADKSEAPGFALDREQLQDGETPYQGGVVSGNDIVLRAETSAEGWFANIQKVFWIDSTGAQRDITTDYTRRIEDGNKTVTIINKTFSYLNSPGNYTLLFKARGYGDVSIPVQIVKAMPAGNTLTYEQDGSVVFRSASSTYLAKDKIKTVTINGTPYPGSAFTITTSSPYSMTIPSEYFDAGMRTVVRISADGYSDFIRTIDIPAGHQKRANAPEVQLELSRVLSGSKIVLTFTDDRAWRTSASAIYRPDAGSSDSKLTLDTSVEGKLTMTAPSATGKGTLIVRSTGYRDLILSIELIAAVPGTVTFELQSDGSVIAAVTNSAYLGKISVTVDGNAVAVTKESGKLTIPAAAFLAKKTYEVALKAEGYADYTFSVNTNVQAAPALTAPVKTLEKQAFTIASGDGTWAGKITRAELLYGSSTYATYLKTADTDTDITAQDGSVTFKAKLGASYGSYTLKIYADGYLTASVPIVFVRAVPQGIFLEAGTSAVSLNVSDYTYRTAIQTIKIGETTLTKGTDFSTASSPISLDKSKFPQGAVTVVITSTGYGDYTTTFDLSTIKQPPAAKLEQSRILSGGNIVLTFTDDSAWRNSIHSAIYRPDGTGSYDRTLTPDKDTAGSLTMKAPSYLTGKGTLIIKASGYGDLTVPMELIEAVPGTITSEIKSDGSVVVAVSSSTYLGKISVMVDGANVTVTKESGKLTIPSVAFPSQKTYEVVLKAEGYADYTFTVNTNVQAAPALTAPAKPLEKQAFTIASGDGTWAGKITRAELLYGSSVYVTYSKTAGADSDITVEGGNATFKAKTMASSGSYTLKIYADGYLNASLPITFVQAVPQEKISFEAGESAVLLNVSDSSYRSAIQTIQVGGATLTKGTDFSTGSSPISLDKNKFPAEQVDVVINAAGYADYVTTFNLGVIQQAPAVSLPQEVALTSDLVLTSNDSDWANAVSRIEIGKTYFSVADKSKLTVEDGVVTLSADKFKTLLSGNYGGGYTVKIYADGYYTKQLSNVTIYSKGSSAFLKKTTWEDGVLKVDLSDGSYSYYSVDKVFVDGVDVTALTGFTRPTSSTKPLIIPAGAHFTEKAGGTVTIKITGSSSSYPPDLTIQVDVPH